MNLVIAAVLNSLWQAVAIAACAWAILKFAPRMNAATRHAVWWAVLVTVIALPAAPALMHRTRAGLRTPVVHSAGFDEAVAPAPAIPAPIAPAVARPAAAIELRPGVWRAILPAIWLAALLLQIARVAWSYRYLRGLKRRAAPAAPELQGRFEKWLLSCRIGRPARLLISNEIASPMAAGFFRPAVILPHSLLDPFGEEELDHVLLHELAHLARRDDWTNLAARLAAALVALHPVAAWILRRIEKEREIACDDWVVSRTGDARPYARSLARLFEMCRTRKRVLLASGMADRASHLGERIEELLRRRREFTPDVSAMRVAASLVALLGFALVVAGTPAWIGFAPSASPAHAAGPQSTPAMPVPATPRRVRQSPAPAAAAASAQTSAPPQGGLLAALVAAGYGDLSVEEIIELKDNGVTAEFIGGIRQSGWGKPSVRELINLRNHGVPPDYAAQMRDARLRDLTIDHLIELRNHGVRPEFVREIHALGFGPYSSGEIIDMHTRGVRGELFRALKDKGFLHARIPEIIDAQAAGLRDSDLREAKQYGSGLTLPQILKLKRAGVLR